MYKLQSLVLFCYICFSTESNIFFIAYFSYTSTLEASCKPKYKKLNIINMPIQTKTNAQNSKKDEFYTQYHEIEKEVSAYLEYDSF